MGSREQLRLNRDFEFMMGIDLNAPREDHMTLDELARRPPRPRRKDYGPSRIIATYTIDHETRTMTSERVPIEDLGGGIERALWGFGDERIWMETGFRDPKDCTHVYDRGGLYEIVEMVPTAEGDVGRVRIKTDWGNIQRNSWYVVDGETQFARRSERQE